MVTLKTLDTASAQEVFDQITEHLLTQQKRSVAGPGCMYKTTDGLRCAAGCLISDEEYREEMEGYDWRGILDTFSIANNHMALIVSMQRLHDDRPVDDWRAELAIVASMFQLNTKVLKQFDRDETCA
jgi:hypothetical protein